ncbi:chemotaxis protein CheD [Sphingomonas sp. AP4-R1]|uniref:chemotaxis protein CheD n=1 Tax=Sphingomonas sp. AP4-R1 TaxID=2735134 RepID=UPI001493BD9E|nr:chemotaxis protein CheD [Sphingomonas sp. AP4-R1]QJU57452.1 chemotaxis protein CheD [Sphingomonas sp. AP4-R1]
MTGSSTATAPRPAPEQRRMITIVEGTQHVTRDPAEILTTVLGSCVAACLFDPMLGIGGMNHFLLAEPDGSAASAAQEERYGAYAMELLVNEMLKRGALRSRLRAHLYGGGSLRAGMADIGARNGAFARDFLEKDGIEIRHMNLGGQVARRIEFRAARGQARCRVMPIESCLDQVPARRQAPPPSSGDVELF